MSTASFYPLAAGNEWEYKQKDGSTYKNLVTSLAGDLYDLLNTAANSRSQVRKSGSQYLTDSWEAGKFQPFLADDLQAGQSWEVRFTANGLNSIMVYTVKACGVEKEVEGKNYEDVLFLEAESKIEMNGQLIPLNYLTQYYYAKGVGLILTTTNHGDYHGLVSFSIN